MFPAFPTFEYAGMRQQGGTKKPAIGAVIMAAGAGRRMGGAPKSLLRRDGEPLLLRQVRLAAEAGAEAIVVVLGHHAESLTAALEQARSSPALATGTGILSWAVNPDPDAGVGSSLYCGLRALPADLTAWLVLLGDQPLLECRDVRMILESWRTRPAGIELVLPQHAGQPGHPVAFGPAVRNAVVHARGRQGVREWRRAHPRRVAAVSVPHARCTVDVDTPADLERLRAEYGVCLKWPQAAGVHGTGAGTKAW